jgi:hypothetical protein
MHRARTETNNVTLARSKSSMRNGDGKLSSILCGTSEQVAASRALAEFRSGRPVIVAGGNETLLCLPVEALLVGSSTQFLEPFLWTPRPSLRTPKSKLCNSGWKFLSE